MKFQTGKMVDHTKIGFPRSEHGPQSCLCMRIPKKHVLKMLMPGSYLSQIKHNVEWKEWKSVFYFNNNNKKNPLPRSSINSQGREPLLWDSFRTCLSTEDKFLS